jgi:pimeloyl-ACP methyl ester carboxylesterase
MSSIEVSGSRVEYLERGRGEPLVLLHSSGCSGAQWRALAERLSARYRVLAPDLYGYGATAPWPGRGPLRLAHEAQIVRAMLERAGAPAHLVGHSYGGAVALHVAREDDAALRSLMLVEPVAFHLLHGRDARALAEIIAVAERVAAAVACGDYEGGFAGFVDYWSGAGAWDAIPAAKRTAMAARLAKVALDFHATLSEPARLEDFGMTAVPTLLVRGERSPRPTRRICELLASVLPECRLETVAGAGHMAPLTHREQVNALITANLEANSGRPSRRPAAVRHFAGTLV